MKKYDFDSLLSAMKWPKWKALLVIVVITLGVNIPKVNAQFLPTLVPLMDVYPFFDKGYITKNGIKEISTEVMYKWPMQKLVFATERVKFTFGVMGNVEKRVVTNKSGNTITYKYFLSNKGRLVSQQEHTRKKDIMKLFSYDEKGLMTELLITDSKTGKEQEKQVFSYEHYTDFQYKKYWLNSEGLTYKYTTVNLDEKERITEERTRFIRGAMRETTYYTYEKERLISYSYNVKEASRRETKYVMTYDSNQRIIEVEAFKDGALIDHFEYLYEKGLMTAILKKNIKTHQITITKFRYSY